MAGLLERIEESGIDRRQFIGLAATAGVVASLGLTGCENKVTETPESSEVYYATDPLTGGEWKTMTCSQFGCGSACMNQGYLVDGIILRHRYGETIEDTVDNPQYRSCIRGRSIRHYITAPDRLKYPMKRKNWQPGGGANTHGELRGIDEWERISWDEAIKYIADEYKRIMDTYGPRAFLTTGQGDAKLANGRCGSGILDMLGGCLTTFGQQSQGGAPVPSKFMTAHWDNGTTDACDRMAQRHSKLIFLMGFNNWNIGNTQLYDLLNAKKEAGAKVILVDPWFTPGAQVVADEWIPIHPSTDGALLEALAHEIIINNWQDQDFLDRCTVGFDADHMPPDAKTNENFKDHILGVYDGTPKTAEWASPITGIAVDTIKKLAKELAETKPLSMKCSLGVVRTYYGNRHFQLFTTLGWMLGNTGVLGADNTVIIGAFGLKNGDSLVSGGSISWKYPKNPICTEPRADGLLTGGKFDPEKEYGIAFGEWHKAVATGEYTLPGPKHEKRACDIKCITCENTRNSTNAQSGNSYADEAYRKVEFVVHQELFMKAGPLYSDIVLPVKSELEMEFVIRTSDDTILLSHNVLPPYYECKDDVEIYFLLCDALGIGEDVAPRSTCRQNLFEKLAGSEVIKESGDEFEKLLTITQSDIDELGVTCEPQEGRITLKEFMETGYYRVMRKPNDNFVNVYLEDYRKDPEANPIKTTSGKLEIYCQALKDYYDRCQLNDIDVIPKYKPMPDGYEQITQNPEYKYQLITPHLLRQTHSQCSNNKTLNEVFPNDLVMSAFDAKREGFKSGDWVLVTGKDAGSVARRINAVPNLAPGVVLLGDGNWRRIDKNSGVDIGGNPNTLTRSQLLGDGYQAYNTVLLKIAPYTGAALLPDYSTPRYIPVAG